MRKTLLAVTMMVAALAGTTARPALAATTGAQRFNLFGDNNGQTVIASGTVFAVGESIPIDEDHDRFVFPNGSFLVTHPETSNDERFNEVACLGTATFAGTYTLSQGTGAYAGISGSGTYSGKAIFVADRTPTGCSEEGSAWFFVSAPGSVTLP